MPTPTIAWLRELVRHDTTSFRSNLPLIDTIEDYLGQHGIGCQRFSNPEQTKANLFASIGPAESTNPEGGILLSGHTDVVPVAGQDWHSNPFELVVTEQTCTARGAADMKGFLASVLAAVPAMLAEPLQTRILLAFSFDEEVGCLGVRHLLDFRQHQPRPDVVIVGEPTMMQPVNAHKGKLAFELQVTGKSGHSAYTSEGVNAINYAAQMAVFIESLHQQRASHGPFDHGYRVPHTTLHIGTIQGGQALNIVPEQCVLRFEIRHIPGEDPVPLLEAIQLQAEKLTQMMQQQAPECGIVLQPISEYPGLHTDESNPAVDWLRQLLDSNQPLQQVSFGTEGGLFSRDLNVPVLVCGPGDIAQAHKPDEFISLSQLEQCDQFLSRLITYCRAHRFGATM